jgi:hypothetical protein
VMESELLNIWERTHDGRVHRAPDRRGAPVADAQAGSGVREAPRPGQDADRGRGSAPPPGPRSHLESVLCRHPVARSQTAATGAPDASDASDARAGWRTQRPAGRQLCNSIRIRSSDR